MIGAVAGGARQSPHFEVGALVANKYRIDRVLGAGAMGVVYAATHEALGKQVALKTLRSDISGDTDLMARFRQEARSASAIGNPHIVQVFDLGVWGEAQYMVMELLDGQSWADLIETQPVLAPERVCRLVGQVLKGLSAAHRRGIVHRDLKPENVFLERRDDDPEFVKILDFGIAKVLGEIGPAPTSLKDSPRPTAFGTVMGTPQYMAPEQARGLTDLDHRVDLWAAGCVAYESLCGRAPFEGQTYNQVLAAIIEGVFPRPRELTPSMSPALEAVLMRALERDPARRYGSADEMREALAGAAGAPAAVGQAPGPMSTLALAGASPSAGGTTQGLGALDAPAGALQLQDLEGAPEVAGPGPSAFEPPEATRTRPAAPRALGTREKAPAADFAPPADEDEDLELGNTFGPQVSTAQIAVTPRAAGGTMAPVQRSGGGGAIVGWLLALVVVAAAAGAGYRYHRLGYLWQAPPPGPVDVALAPQPEDAVVFVDGAERAERSIRAVPDERYQVEFRHPRRLTVRYSIAGGTAAPRRLAARLPVAVRALTPATPSVDAAPLLGDTGPHQVDLAVEKLARVRDCLDGLGDLLEQSLETYRASAGKRPRRGSIPAVVAVDAELESSCLTRLRAAADQAPALDGVDHNAESLAEALAEVGPMSRKLAAYYENRGYRDDSFSYGRSAHARFPGELESAIEAESFLRRSLVAQRQAWDEVELANLRATDGVGALWHVRNVALRLERWVAAEVADASKGRRDGLREQFVSALDDARAFADTDPAQLAVVEGADNYLGGLAALAKMARGSNRSAADLLGWHARSVKVFNGMVVVKQP